ncbi:MAG TPA: hypothetical protein VNZ86_04140 [Bacteroidia bacterium]|nr:hypothetical protein [Bacteroidia bacterium]
MPEPSHFFCKRRNMPLHPDSFSGTTVLKRTGMLRSKYFRHYLLFQPIRNTQTARIPSSLHVQFRPNSDSLVDLKDTLSKLKGLAGYMRNNSSAKLCLSGNTGTDLDDKAAPLGTSDTVLNYPATLNGILTSTSALMLARASVIRQLLIDHYHIRPSRINVQTGAQTFGPQGRFVGVVIRTPY